MQPVLRSRVLPRISFRAMMAITFLAAILATTARAAGDGATFAKAVISAVGFVAIFFILAIGSFLVSWLVARLIHNKANDSYQGSPFASGSLPPQIIKPREPVQ